MQTLYELANTYWNLWLAIIFFIIVAFAYWPSKKTQKKMDDAAQIPFKND